jgi:hypothetical protein
VLRLAVTPNRLLFMRGLLNIVDLIAIFPFYLELFMSICGFDVDSLSDIKGLLAIKLSKILHIILGAFLVVRIMRVLRVVRILKLSRYSTGKLVIRKILHICFRHAHICFDTSQFCPSIGNDGHGTIHWRYLLFNAIVLCR